MVAVSSNSITLVASLMGLLLVGVTSYAQTVSSNPEAGPTSRLYNLFRISFAISFGGGGVLLILSLWGLVSESIFQVLLTLWIIAVVLTGSVITLQLFQDTFKPDQGGDIPVSDPMPESGDPPESQ